MLYENKTKREASMHVHVIDICKLRRRPAIANAGLFVGVEVVHGDNLGASYDACMRACNVHIICVEHVRIVAMCIDTIQSRSNLLTLAIVPW